MRSQSLCLNAADCCGKILSVVCGILVPKRVGEDHALTARAVDAGEHSIGLLDVEIERLKISRPLPTHEINPVALAEIDRRGGIQRKSGHVKADSPIQDRVVSHVAELPQAAVARR